MIRLKYDKTRWEITPDFEPSLRAVLASPGRVVKESKAKLVTEHRLDERIFFIKRYRHFAVPLRPLKFFLKASQAREEWRLAQSVEERGIPAVRHVALGERWSAFGLQESILITEGFAGVPANEALGLRSEDVVAFVDRMAKAGVVQGDFHPANLLVRREPFEIRLVDLHGTFISQRVSALESEANRDAMLAHLCVSFPLDVPNNVERLSREIRKRAWNQRSRRCLKANRDFSIARFRTLRWNIRTAAVTENTKAILDAPDEFIERGRLLKNGRSSTLTVAQGLVLKRYNFKKPFNALKDLFRGSRGRRGFRKAYHLELCGIATPLVIATADDRLCGLPMRSYVLMEEVSNAIDAGKWAGPPRDAARALGALLARMHNEGFTHRDLKETNILFDSAGAPHLIDLDGLKFVSDVAPHEAAANLQRLAFGLAPAGKLPRSNTIAFLITYCRTRAVRPRQLFPRTPVEQ